MLPRWRKNSFHSINIWDIVTKVVPLCLAYQAPPFAHNFTLINPVSANLDQLNYYLFLRWPALTTIFIHLHAHAQTDEHPSFSTDCMHSELGSIPCNFCICNTLVVQNVEEHRQFQAQQQPHVSIVLMGERRSGLVKVCQLRLGPWQ